VVNNLCLLLFNVQEEMNSALVSMRVDYDQSQLKTLDKSKNPMLEKRRQKSATKQESPPSAPAASTITNVTVL
jgi:hypothetical protein